MHFPSIKWRKLGLVVRPNHAIEWQRSHGMLPTPMKISDTLYRIYFGNRNDRNQSIVNYVEVDLNDPSKILNRAKYPVLQPGRLGTFDDNGVLPSCVIREGNTLWMHHIGFKPGGTTRMDLFAGLCSSVSNGETFERWSEAPILERSRVNPFINTAPWVISWRGGYRMYYVSGVEWVNRNLPRYNIQTAFSPNMTDWEREGLVAMNFAEGENALARPYVIEDDGIYRMWFSSKGGRYIPQYAESVDGINWVRDPRGGGLTPGQSGSPDSEMICYPIVLKNRDQHVVFYNGNNYGEEGICVAVEDN